MAAKLPRDDDGNFIVRIGHSPDPDDAFMFYAMTTNAFPTPGYKFVHELQDIETLNHRAMNKELEVSAVSIHAYPDIAHDYALMNCGASMGEGYGPMIVTKKGVTIDEAKANPIAVPGLKTSAYLGIKMCWGDLDYEVVAFDEIIPKILKLMQFPCSDALSYSHLAEGRVDIVIQCSNKIWDIHPLIPIIEAAGGYITTWDNRSAKNAGNILVSANKTIHYKFLKLLKPVSK